MAIERTTQDSHQPQINIVRTEHGWEVREERNGVTVHVARHTDWHRVERSIQMFERRRRASQEPS